MEMPIYILSQQTSLSKIDWLKKNNLKTFS